MKKLLILLIFFAISIVFMAQPNSAFANHRWDHVPGVCVANCETPPTPPPKPPQPPKEKSSGSTSPPNQTPGTTSSYTLNRCALDSNTNSIHYWATTDDPWVTPKKINYGILAPGECKKASYKVTIPANAQSGSHTTQWKFFCSDDYPCKSSTTGFKISVTQKSQPKLSKNSERSEFRINLEHGNANPSMKVGGNSLEIPFKVYSTSGPGTIVTLSKTVHSEVVIGMDRAEVMTDVHTAWITVSNPSCKLVNQVVPITIYASTLSFSTEKTVYVTILPPRDFTKCP